MISAKGANAHAIALKNIERHHLRVAQKIMAALNALLMSAKQRKIAQLTAKLRKTSSLSPMEPMYCVNPKTLIPATSQLKKRLRVFRLRFGVRKIPKKPPWWFSVFGFLGSEANILSMSVRLSRFTLAASFRIPAACADCPVARSHLGDSGINLTIKKIESEVNRNVLSKEQFCIWLQAFEGAKLAGKQPKTGF